MGPTIFELWVMKTEIWVMEITKPNTPSLFANIPHDIPLIISFFVLRPDSQKKRKKRKEEGCPLTIIAFFWSLVVQPWLAHSAWNHILIFICRRCPLPWIVIYAAIYALWPVYYSFNLIIHDHFEGIFIVLDSKLKVWSSLYIYVGRC